MGKTRFNRYTYTSLELNGYCDSTCICSPMARNLTPPTKNVKKVFAKFFVNVILDRKGEYIYDIDAAPSRNHDEISNLELTEDNLH